MTSALRLFMVLASVLSFSSSAFALDMTCEGDSRTEKREFRLSLALLDLTSANPRMLVSLRTDEVSPNGGVEMKVRPLALLSNGVEGARVFQYNGRAVFMSQTGGILSVSIESAQSLAANHGLMSLPINAVQIPGLPSEVAIDNVLCVAF